MDELDRMLWVIEHYKTLGALLRKAEELGIEDMPLNVVVDAVYNPSPSSSRESEGSGKETDFPTKKEDEPFNEAQALALLGLMYGTGREDG